MTVWQYDNITRMDLVVLNKPDNMVSIFLVIQNAPVKIVNRFSVKQAYPDFFQTLMTANDNVAPCKTK